MNLTKVLPSSAQVEVVEGYQGPLELRGEEEGEQPLGGLEEGQEHHLVLDHTSQAVAILDLEGVGQWVEPVAMEAAEVEEQSYHWSAAAVVSCQWRSQRWAGQQEELWRIVESVVRDEWPQNKNYNVNNYKIMLFSPGPAVPGGGGGGIDIGGGGGPPM